MLAIMFMWFHWCSCGFIDAPRVSLMLLWFHWCSCGFIYAPVVSFTLLWFQKQYNPVVLWCSCGFIDVHWCSCSCGFIYVHVVSLYSWGINFQWYVNVYVKYTNSYMVRDCIDVYMWLKGPPPRSFWSSQLLHQTILSYEPMSHPSKLIKCNKGLSKVGLSLKYIKVQRKYGLIAPHDVEKFWSIYNIDKFV